MYFMYYDAIVMHGPGVSSDSFRGIRKSAMKNAKTPAQGGDEKTYLLAFATARKKIMKQEDARSDASRVDDAQLKFLRGAISVCTPVDVEDLRKPARDQHETNQDEINQFRKTPRRA